MEFLDKVQGVEGPKDFNLINQNEFSYRRHKKQKEEDIAVCDCKYDINDPDNACGDHCLNVLTSTECTPGYCPTHTYCKNQKFQRCEYAKTTLFKTEGRGWGLLADENIKAGQFIIEYCGEVISWKEAKRRAQAYENQGVRDAYIICLNSDESIDATRKGSLARFINHSCQPNCETRKWTVLGEIRVGIFAKHDIPIGTELAYDYNFEWYGGAKVRCLCGAVNCSGFLGAKSRGFKEDTYLWEDDDQRYSVENIPLYDSAEDEPSSHLIGLSSYSLDVGENDHIGQHPGTTALVVKPLNSASVNDLARDATNGIIHEAKKLSSQGPRLKKKLKGLQKGRAKSMKQRKVDANDVLQLLVDQGAREEILTHEQIRSKVGANLQRLYDEIRPAIEERERDNQDSVPTSLAEKWIEASCLKLKADFDLHFSIIKNVACTPLKCSDSIQPMEETQDGMKLLTN